MFWVARVADEDCLGPVGDSLFELLDRRYLEAVSDICRDCLQGKSVHEGECVVVCIEWLENDHFVAWVTCDFECEVDAFATCYSHDELVNCDVDADLLVVFFNETLAKLHQSGRM